MRLPVLIATSFLFAASACSSSTSSGGTDPGGTNTTAAEVVTTVRTTASPATTVPCHRVDGGRETNLYPGDCDTPGGGGAVRILQESLGMAGYYVSVNGYFGDATEEAVKAFQASAGLVPDGLVGPLTWGALPNPNEIGDEEPEEDADSDVEYEP